MNFKNNDDLKKAVVDGVLDCKGQDLNCAFNIDIDANIIVAGDIVARNINAWDINARDINARNIVAGDIDAWDINARDIDYYAVCFAYKDIVCNDIKGRRHNSKHFVLDGKITTGEKE